MLFVVVVVDDDSFVKLHKRLGQTVALRLVREYDKKRNIHLETFTSRSNNSEIVFILARMVSFLQVLQL